jgi:hypothetical protein
VESPSEAGRCDRTRLAWPPPSPCRDPGGAKRARQGSREYPEGRPGTAEVLQRFQSDMVERFLAFQRESEARQTAWEQERWRMEQTLQERWRQEQRNHDKEMFSMFCNLLSQCSQTILDNRNG